MEQQVMGDIVAAKFNRVLHAGVGGFNVLNILRSGAFRSESDGRRFNHAPQIL